VICEVSFRTVAWDPYLQKDIDCIQKFQRKGAHMVKSSYYYKNNVTDLINELDWISIADRRRDCLTLK